MKTGKKILFLLGFMLVAIFAISPNSVNAANYSVSTFNDLKTRLETSGTTDTITITADINVTGTITIAGNKTITGAKKLVNTMTASANSTMFKVPVGATLTLDGGVTLDGKNKVSAGTANVINEGTLTLKNVTIKNGGYGVYGATSGTAQINITNNAKIDETNTIGVVAYSKVNMTGGTITASKTGIQVNNTSAKLTMSGGTIQGYDETAGSGIDCTNNGSLDISGGTIQIIDPASGDMAPIGHAITYAGQSFTLTDITLGTNQKIYMTSSTGIIDIGTSKPSIIITPSEYTRGRRIVKLTIPSTVTTQAQRDAFFDEIRETVVVDAPKGNDSWMLREEGTTGYMRIWEYPYVTANYLWTNELVTPNVTRQFATSDTQRVWAGETYTTSPITKDHYTLISTPTNASDTMPGEDVDVNYMYKRDQASITVKYIDSDSGNTIETELVKGYVEDNYVSTPKAISGYRVISPEASQTKVFGTDTVVEWQYVKRNTVTVKYIDESTNAPISGQQEVVTEYSYGDVFDQRKIDPIYGYTYSRTTITGATGTTIEGNDVVVTHYYAPNSQVVVKYKDKATQEEIASETVIDGYAGKAYTTSPITIDGYVYNNGTDDHSDNTAGTMSSGTITVEYYYVKLINITIRYVNAATRASIDGYPQVTDQYQEGQTIDRKQIEIPGYTYSNSSSNTTTAGSNDETIIHYYNTTSKIVVRHLDKFDHTIKIKADDDEIIGYAGKPYSTSPLSSLPSDYVYRNDNTGNTSGTMGTSATIVEYYYTKRVPVTIRFIDINTNASLPGYADQTTTYDQGAEYDGRYIGNVGSYTYLNSSVDGADGNKVGATPITITHYYSANSQILVKHVDLNDTNIAVGAAQNVTGYVGDTYTTYPLSGTKLPTNYVYSGRVDGDATGTITSTPKTITYYYVKQVPVTIKYINVNTNDVIEEDKTIYSQGDTIDKKQKDISGYKYIRTENGNVTTVGSSDITITHYYSKDASVIIRHIDKDNHLNEISEPTYLTGNAGESYTATPLTTLPARYVYRGENSGNTTGTFEDEEIEVTFYYTRQAKVTVNYVDKVSGEIIETVSDSVDQNSTLNKKEKEIPEYTYLETTVEGDVNGKVGTEDVTVTHYYAKDSRVIVKYLDKNNNNIALGEEETIIGYEGKTYVTNKLETIPTNYVYRDENTGNTTGNMAAGTTEVVYYYVKRVPVTIKYVDKATQDVLDQRTDIYDEATELDKKQKDFNNYTYLEEITTGTSNNIVGPDDISVTHYYGRNTTVLVRHLDKNNNKIVVAEDEILEGYEGKDYEAVASENLPENYKYEGDNSGNTTGKMARNQFEVDFYYVKQVPVTVNYVDINTDEIIKTVTESYDETTTLDRKERDFDGYTYQKTEVENADGDVIGPDDVTVTHYYAKNTSVIVKYVDQYHPEIEVADRVTIDGFVGKDYETEKLATDPEGYAYRNVNSQNTTGKMTDEKIIVEYYYVKQVPVTVNYVDKFTGDVLDTETEIYDEVTGLDKKEKDFEGYEYSDTTVEGTDTEYVGPDEITITHNYIKQFNLTVKFVDEKTNAEITDKVTIVKKQNDDYTVTAKDVTGYVLAEETTKTGTIGRGDVEVIFYYKKISNGLAVKYIDGITNELLDQDVFEGNVGDYIVAETKVFDGYAIVKEPAEKRVELQADYQEIVFEYNKRVEMIVRGVIQDTGKQVWEYTLTGLEGQTYSTHYEKIDGYELINTSDSINGQFRRDLTEIIYYYGQIELKGDVNLDGYVNSTDAAIVLDCYKSDEPTPEEYLQRGDMDNNNILNAIDAAMILDVFKSNV